MLVLSQLYSICTDYSQTMFTVLMTNILPKNWPDSEITKKLVREITKKLVREITKKLVREISSEFSQGYLS